MDGEDADQAAKGKQPQHLLPWCGQQQAASGEPRVLPPARLKRRRDVRGICDAWLRAQRDGNVTAAFADPEI
jgi:hypothetical protein